MALKGDFIGFTFNSRHSSELGIVHVSGGSRYTENLLPSSQDKTVQVPGGDGTYFFGSEYTLTPFNINFATDCLSEQQFRELRQWLNVKEIHELIFDETPYKVYSAKITGTPVFNYICFDNPRVYKGEGTIQFTCYYPYAKSNFKYLNEYSDLIYKNKLEWAASSGMLSQKGTYDGSGATINLYNPGDLETDFYAYYEVSSLSDLTKIYINSNILNFDFSQNEIDTDFYIRINTKANLIEGCDENFQTTGNLYNKFITSGDFFKIPLGESQLLSVGASCVKIEYNYLYY